MRFIRQALGDRVHVWPFDGWDGSTLTLFRWFVGLGVDDPVLVATVFSKNRDFPQVSRVRRYFYDWRGSGLLGELNHCLVVLARQAAGALPARQRL